VHEIHAVRFISVTQTVFYCRRYRWELWCMLLQLRWKQSLGYLCGPQSLQQLQSPSFTRRWYYSCIQLRIR